MKLNQTHLVLRAATPADIDALVAFTADVLRHQDADEPDARTGAWTRDLLEGVHPRVRCSDFTVVEDARTGRIVSSAGLISQTWTYAGLPIEVGQLELIGTEPAYRGRGLVRAQIERLHDWSAARGQRVVAIDGIPWFYRQFGYEMALELRGEISIDASMILAAAEGEARPVRIRQAVERDFPFLTRVYQAASARTLVSCERGGPEWRLELGRRETSFYRLELRVIESAAGEPCGFLAHAPQLAGGTLGVVQYELDAGAAWAAVTPDVLRHLRTVGRAYAERRGEADVYRLGLCLGTEHPAYELVPPFAPRDEGAYAWYLRVADLPSLIQHLVPVLERRLAASAAAGHSGTLLISFYRDGLRLDLDRGRIVAVSAWRPALDLPGVERNQPTRAARAAASFPGLAFLQLLFGYRSFDELRHAFADCIVRTPEAYDLLTALFPKQPSNVWAVM